MSENKKVFFIINKYSGTGFQSEVEGKIIDTCAQAGKVCEIQYTQHRGHATELAREAAKTGFPVVFAMGGDGTVNEVAQGLVHSSTALGILPKGSGNGLARHLGIPLEFSQAIELIKSGQTNTIDTFLVNGRLSVNVSGIGFDGHVAGMFGQKSKRGLLGYTKLVLQEFRSFPEFTVTLQHDQQTTIRSSFVIALANSSQFGNNAKVAPLASVRDQLIDICLIRKLPLRDAPLFLARLFSGTVHQSIYTETIQAKTATITTQLPIAYHIDGEPFPPVQQLTVAIQPLSLHVVLPTAHRKKI
jgi:diacylglycerol kinase (ATP)